MQKAGLRYEGTSLQSDWNNQGICDVVNYMILSKEDFANLSPVPYISPVTRIATKGNIETVTDLLCKLYNSNRDELLVENIRYFNDERQCFFLDFAEDKPIGVAHVSLRSDYVNGTELCGTCGFLEGIYVKHEYRRNGVASALVSLCESWAREQGCHEFASDCLIYNTDSYLFHYKD